jgi:hypothetical protein
LFDAELLAAVVSETDVSTRLEAIHALDLIRPELRTDEYVFKHALVRDALYQSLLTNARKALHLKIAEEIERRSGNRLTEVAEVMAHHYSQTDQADKAFTYLSMAGSKSLGVYSLDEAATHLTAALAVLDTNPACASDDQVVEFLVSYLRLLNLTHQIKIAINVTARYLARVDRVADDPRAIIIRLYYIHALCYNLRYREAATVQQQCSLIAYRLSDSTSKMCALAGKIFVSTLIAPMPLHEFELLNREAIAAGTADADIHANLRAIIGWEEINRGRVNQARDSARELIQVGQSLNDPRSTGFGLRLLAFIALISDSYAEALEYSEQSLSVAITADDQISALGAKAFALVLLRRIEEGVKFLEEYRHRCRDDSNVFSLRASEGILGLCKIFQGRIADGIHVIEEAILREEKDGYRTRADWHRINLAEIYLQILGRNEKAPFLIILRNLPILFKVTLTASPRIRTLIASVLENPHLDPMGHHVGHAQMILGLLYKLKKKRTLAVQHLTEARRILSQFGQTPILARVDTALAELKK